MPRIEFPNCEVRASLRCTVYLQLSDTNRISVRCGKKNGIRNCRRSDRYTWARLRKIKDTLSSNEVEPTFVVVARGSARQDLVPAERAGQTALKKLLAVNSPFLMLIG